MSDRPYPNVPPGFSPSSFTGDIADFMGSVHQHEGVLGASHEMVRGWFWKLRAILDHRALTERDFAEIVTDGEARVLLGLFFLWNPDLVKLARRHESQPVEEVSATPSSFDPERTMMHTGLPHPPSFDADRTMMIKSPAQNG